MLNTQAKPPLRRSVIVHAEHISSERIDKAFQVFDTLTIIEKTLVAGIIWRGENPQELYNSKSGAVYPEIFARIRAFLKQERGAFNARGFDTNGIHRTTFRRRDLSGYDADGFRKDGYTANDFDRRGFDRDGKHRDTGTLLNPDSIDRHGWKKNWAPPLGFEQRRTSMLPTVLAAEFDKFGIHRVTKTPYDVRGNDRNGKPAPGGPKAR
jgi:hypothetical protein